MYTPFQFHHFKKFARYLLEAQLPALSQSFLALIQQSNLPIYKVFSSMSDEEQLAMAGKSVQHFLENVVADKALAAALKEIDQWYANQSANFTREQIASADIVLGFSIRKKLYMQFLPLYTPEQAVALQILQEFEDFTTAVSQRAFEVYDRIQQEELRQERNLLDSVIDNSIDGIMAFDQELHVRSFNRVLQQHFGLSKAEVLGRKLFDVFPEYQHTAVGDAIEAALQGQHVYLKDKKYRKKEGFYDLHVFPLKEADGSLGGIIGLMHDITQRKQHEDVLHLKSVELQGQKDELLATVEELQASNEELEVTRKQLEEVNRDLEDRIHLRTEQLEYQRQWLYSLFMQVPGLIGILSGEEGSLVLFNQAFSKLLGGRQVLGMPMREAWPELEGQGYFEDIEEVMRTGKTITRQEFPGLINSANDGKLQQAYFNFVYLPYLNPKGEVEGVIMYGVDVTEQVESRRKIEESEEKLKLALESAQMGTWDYDPISGYAYYSPLFYDIFGYKEDEISWNYTQWLQHIAHEFKEYVIAQYQQALNTGALQYDARILTKQGISRWISVRGKVFFDEQKSPVRYAGVVLDITDRKEAEEALKRNHEELTRINTDLDNFIYTASHDLRSPIVNLESLIMLLSKGLSSKLESEHQQLMTMMSTSIGRLKRTIDALTDITRIHKEDQQQETLAFEHVLNEVKLDLETQLAESGAYLTLDLQVPTIRFAPHNLRSMLYNLLSNAIKYRNPEKPLRIKISTYASGEYTVLSIQDNGLGISTANQKKLFSMFKRFHTHVKGSGIGLYLIKRIIENVGGKIEAESQEGEGSTFRLYMLNN